ncbi:MAG: tetratricopeptide repeat protein [Termitinemataceae bacterium]|nr:MAG: tetratricopeptide repeat protein [Termitinemataceae bacterium]
MYIKKSTVIFSFIFLVTSYLAFAQSRPDAQASYRSGRNFENQGKPVEAAESYNEAIRICQDEIKNGIATMDSYAVLTATLRRQRKFTEVISSGNEALKINTDYRIIETMGEAHFYLGNFSNSLQCMQRYTNQLPQGDSASVAYFFIGEIYRAQKKFNYADIAYTTAVKLTPTSALWWFRLGQVRESLGNNQSALEAYNKALQIDPGYSNAQEAVAKIKRT